MINDDDGTKFTPKQAAIVALWPIINVGAMAWEDELDDRDFSFGQKDRELIEKQVNTLVDRIERLLHPESKA